MIAFIRRLYVGTDGVAAGFQYALLAFDVTTISLFLVISFVGQQPWVRPAEITVGTLLTLDFAARLVAARRRWNHLLRPTTLADAIVIGSLFAPALTDSWAFLRILRALRLLRSYHVLGLMRRKLPWVKSNEQVIISVINLVVFIFFMTAIVFVTQSETNPQIANYMDALYFTMATLTTTGFGDVTLQGDFGRTIAILIMIFGISLFLRLIQAVFRPSRVHFPCPHCGLTRHDPDAVHCKHCGVVLNIPTEGQV